MTEILMKAQEYCMELLINSRCFSLPFHNVQHTKEVYENVLLIGAYEKKNIKELEPVLLAALFHDIGNAIVFTDHEKFSVAEARIFLKSQLYPKDKIALVIKCINATRMPQRPRSIYEKIICDADLFHLGTKSYQSKNTLLRKEWSLFLNTKYTDKEWDDLNSTFLERHQFHTTYGKTILDPVKQKNLREMASIVR